jgi:inosose dehydratase
MRITSPVFCMVLAIASICSLSPIHSARAEEKKGYNPRVCVGMYAWVQDRGKKGTNLWDDLDAVLSEVKAAGFGAVEGFLADFCGSDERVERARQLLARHHVSIAGLYIGGNFHDEAVASKTVASILTMAESARKLQEGIFIDVNPDPLQGGKPKTSEQLATQVKMLNDLGGKLRTIGMYLVIHQHAPEILQEAREYRYDVAHLDPKLVGICADTHWFYRGGQDPMTLLKEAGSMVKVLHLRNSRDGVWTESFGPGDIDYKTVAEYLRSIGFDGWLSIELAVEGKTQVTRSITDNHRLSREYLESVFLDKK